MPNIIPESSTIGMQNRKLPITFIRSYGYGIGEIYGPRMFTGHRNAEERRSVSCIEVFWQTGRFVPEHKCIPRLEAAIIERTFSVRRKHQETTRFRRREIVLPCIVNGYVKMRPVVQSSPGDRLVIESKSKRTHQMKRSTQSNTQPAYRARVVRNLGPHENNRELRHSFMCKFHLHGAPRTPSS